MNPLEGVLHIQRFIMDFESFSGQLNTTESHIRQDFVNNYD